MDAIDQALAQVRAEIEHIQTYLAKLQEAERELVMVRETRQVIAQGWQASHADVPEKITTPDVPTGPIVTARPPPVTQPPLATAILGLLQTAGCAMTPKEINTALRSTGRQMHENAVTSKLSQLANSGTVVKQEGAKYSLPSRASRIITSLESFGESTIPRRRQSSLPTQAYAVLKEIGRPLTGNEIVAVLRAKGQDVNPRSVITALYHLAQDGQLFRRMGSKTFGLLEWPEQFNGQQEPMGLLDMTRLPHEYLSEEPTKADYSGHDRPSIEGSNVPVLSDNNNFIATEEAG